MALIVQASRRNPFGRVCIVTMDDFLAQQHTDNPSDGLEDRHFQQIRFDATI